MTHFFHLGAVYPVLETQKRDVKMSYINRCTGLNLDAKQTAGLLSRMALSAEASPSGDSVLVEIPPSRTDILHDCDVMEVCSVHVCTRFDVQC